MLDKTGFETACILSSRKMFKTPIPKSPYDPPYSIHWDFDTSTFLKRPDVKGRPPKVITWMAPVGYLPSIPEPVRLRTCPEMPCRITTNREFRAESAALIWNAPKMKESKPPERTSPDQVIKPLKSCFRTASLSVSVAGKTSSLLQTLVYDILPSITAITDHAIGLEKLSDKRTGPSPVLIWQ